MAIRTYSDARHGVPKVTIDATANDSDKAIAVPSGKVWKIENVFVSLTTSGTAGNRTITVEIRDASSNVLFKVSALINQAASLTRTYCFAPGFPHETSGGGPGNDHVLSPMPEIWMDATWDVHVYDESAVDPTADDMDVRITYLEVTG